MGSNHKIIIKMTLVFRFLLLSLCFLPLLAEIAPLSQFPTLQQMAQTESGKSSLFSKAITFLSGAHPELGHYFVQRTKRNIDRGGQEFTSNLKDFHFDLAFENKRVLAIVTVGTGVDMEFVSISPFVMALEQPQGAPGMGEYWISETIPTTANGNITNLSVSSAGQLPENLPGSVVPLGGYRYYSDFKDPEVQRAIDLVAAEHPNMVNYKLDAAAYQMVAGLNVRLEYRGIDNYSNVVAIVGFDLERNMKLLAFGLVCQDSGKYCTGEAAWEYFNSIETLIVRHPELISYRIVRLDVSHTQEMLFVKVKVTFENSARGLSTMTEMDIEKNKSSVKSFFTFSL